jgi:dolichol-phosphate mannosyltransferase
MTRDNRIEVDRIHVVLPAYNEELSLPGVLSGLAEFRRNSRPRITAWVIDDGSTDGTAAVAAAAAGTRDLDVRLVSHPRNLGLGQAVNTGFRVVLETAGPDDVAVVMDSDDSHPAGVIDALVEAIEGGADLAIASRFVPGGADDTAPAFRRLLSRGAAWTFRLLLPLSGYRDFTSGYRAYRTSLLRRAQNHWGQRLVAESGFACMVELLLKLRYCNPVVREVPLVLRYDRKQGASKLKLARTLVQYLKLGLRDRLSPPPAQGL